MRAAGLDFHMSWAQIVAHFGTRCDYYLADRLYVHPCGGTGSLFILPFWLHAWARGSNIWASGLLSLCHHQCCAARLCALKIWTQCLHTFRIIIWYANPPLPLPNIWNLHVSMIELLIFGAIGGLKWWRREMLQVCIIHSFTHLPVFQGALKVLCKLFGCVYLLSLHYQGKKNQQCSSPNHFYHSL